MRKHMKKNKFEFVNNNEEEVFETKDSDVVTKNELTEEEKERRRKREFQIKVVKATIFLTLLSTLITLFGLFWQDDYSLMAIGDALWLTFAILLGTGWIMFVYNENIFSPLLHGLKTLGLMVVGKRPKEDYYHYMKNIQENPIPKFYYVIVFIFALITLIPALIIMFMFL